MIWVLIIANIIGWSLAIVFMTMTGLLLLVQGANAQKAVSTQRPNITPKVKMFNLEKYEER
jgi:hypothetical protein